MNIPFYDLNREHAAIAAEMRDTFDRIYAQGQFIGGKEVTAFEEEFAQYLGADHCIGAGNGLDALRLTLESLDVGPGDEVIVPAHTFIATWLAVSMVGAKPVPVEPSIQTFNIDPEQIEAHITAATKAIIVVHLYGVPAQMQAIQEIANKHDLAVIEDAAQAQGARVGKQRCGAIGDLAAFSFYPAKNLGALGDAGLVVCQNAERAKFIQQKRNYGSEKKYHHGMQGYNSRLDELQAAWLRVKLKKLDDLNEKRNAVADFYLHNISRSKLKLPVVSDDAYSVWHQFVVQVENRQGFMAFLAEKGVQTHIHYPIPPHQCEAYASEDSMWDLPITEKLAQQVVSLPMYPFLKAEEMEYIVDVVNQFNG
ncbi:DegT/DnrJ/EryC1/StrS family aminotransferase [Marinicella sp. W31]|uniref:DegT/DnrJ/EryC1/StrS family aminotransferase n=1 Tax=Marinicella sp. W31 TaxID=3023713 RepID=UPI003756BB32